MRDVKQLPFVYIEVPPGEFNKLLYQNSLKIKINTLRNKMGWGARSCPQAHVSKRCNVFFRKRF